MFVHPTSVSVDDRPSYSIPDFVAERLRYPERAVILTLHVRMDDGSVRTTTQENITDLRTGDRVRMDGDYIQRV